MSKKTVTPKKYSPTTRHLYAEFMLAVMNGEITAKGLDDRKVRQGTIEYDDAVVIPP